MKFAILSQMQVTTDELAECRQSKGEQKRLLRVQKSLATTKALLGNNPSKVDLHNSLSEIGKVSGFAELGVEAATTVRARRLWSALVIQACELDTLLQQDIDNKGVLSRISSVIRATLAIFSII